MNGERRQIDGDVQRELDDDALTVRGVLFDRPQVVETARGVLQAPGVAERCEIIGGDSFESVPPGGHIYVLSTVLHDWPDDRATQILRHSGARCSQAWRAAAHHRPGHPAGRPGLGRRSRAH
jgi:hypothetical protein